MSWQAYVDTNLVGTGNVKQAGIFGAADGSTWAVSAGFQPSGAEVNAVRGHFANPNGVFSSGITVCGTKYLGIKADERSVYGKKGAGGVVCVKTTQAVLICTYDETIQPGPAATTVEKLADYLIENSY
jgi:profilin